MPAQTPTGIIYPCSGENIDPGVFATYAQTTQDAIVAVAAQATQALRPPAVLVRTEPAGQTVAAGATTLIGYSPTALMYDTDAMFNSGAPTLITIQTGGTYLVSVWFTRVTSPATLSSSRVNIRLNGADRAYHKSDGGGPGTAAAPFFVSALLSGLVVGDQITSTHLFTGVGTMEIRHAISVMKVSST